MIGWCQQGHLSESEIAANLYDQFTVSISDVKVLLADSGEYKSL